MRKSKDEVFNNIVYHYALMKNHFGKTVKCFRSDNGTEFVNNRMSQFFNKEGILHQTSIAYTP